MAAPGHALTLRNELFRKALHLTAVAIPVAYARGTPRPVLEAVLAFATAFALIIEGVRRASPAAEAAFERVVGPLLRPGERVTLTGATWLLISCFAAVLLFGPHAAIAALWCATAGDPAATIAGRLWTRSFTADRTAAVPALKANKTIAGSLACAIVSFGGVRTLAGYAAWPSLVIAIAAAIGETLPGRLDDNVRVAGAAGAVAQLLS